MISRFGAILVAIALSTLAAAAQTGSWLPCPRCQTEEQRAAALAAVKGRAFDPRDLSGVWGRGGAELSTDVPPMTPWGQAKFHAAIPGHGPRAQPLGNDPMMICDPLGYPRWLGYAVGRWEGDTFVVESTGYSDRAWVTELAYPQSDQLRLTERYRRTSFDTLEIEVTLNDPKAYARPWVSRTSLRLSPATELGEYFCVPSDEEEYLKAVRSRAGGNAR